MVFETESEEPAKMSGPDALRGGVWEIDLDPVIAVATRYSLLRR